MLITKQTFVSKLNKNYNILNSTNVFAIYFFCTYTVYNFIKIFIVFTSVILFLVLLLLLLCFMLFLVYLLILPVSKRESIYNICYCADQMSQLISSMENLERSSSLDLDFKMNSTSQFIG